MRNSWRLDALDKWRTEIDGRLSRLEQRVGDLTKADEIAEAVAQKMRSERTLGLTFVQKVGGGLFALALVLIPILVQKL